MVVVAIIGILAAVAVPTYQGYVTAAKHAACKMEAAGAFKAYLAYKESPDVLKGPDGITDPRTQSISTNSGGNTVTTHNIAIDGEYYTYTSNNPNCNGTATMPTKGGAIVYNPI